MRLSQSDWKYIDKRAARFLGRTWVFERVRSFLEGPERLLLVCGPPGTGKTAVAARLAQASDGRGEGLVVSSGAFDAALFCRAGRIDLLEASHQISDQLSESSQEFARHRLALGGVVIVQDLHLTTGTIAEGAQVTGVKIDLGRDPEQAFASGVALPLRRLPTGSRPAVLLVDALDEAFSAPNARELPRLLAALEGVKIVATARDDPRVLALLGDSTVRVHLLDDAPSDSDDSLAFLTERFRGLGPDEAMGVLAARIARQAKGNFLYCAYLADAIVDSGVLAGLDASAAKRVPVPRGGLSGVYREFLRRELTRDENAEWADRIQPVLAPLAVAYGDGLNVSQLQAIASNLAGRRISGMIVRDVVRKARQFLQGPLTDGPFLPYHQSFAEFLTDAVENPDWVVDPVETHSAVVDALAERVPKDEAGRGDWEMADVYTRTYLSIHAARARALDKLLIDSAFLLGANAATLLGVLGDARSREGRAAAAAYRRVAHRLSASNEPSRLSYLQLAALQVGANWLAGKPNDDPNSAPSPWRPLWGWWRPATPSRTLGQLSSAADTLATAEVDDMQFAVVGGAFGLEVWDVRTARRLTFHAWRVKSLAVCHAEGRTVVLAGHEDGGVAVHDLPSLAVLAHDTTRHSGAVLACAGAGESLAVTGDAEGTLVLWRLPTLEQVGGRANAHTMVRALATAAVDGFRTLVSAGDTVRPDGTSDPGVTPVRVWTIPALELVANLEPTAGLVRVVQALASPSGVVVVAERLLGISAHLVALGGTVTPIGSLDLGHSCEAGLVLEEGATPVLLVASSNTLTHVRLQLGPLPSIQILQQIDVAESGRPRWAGPIGVDRVLVSAAAGVRTWDLDDVLSSAGGRPATPEAQRESGVILLAAAGEILAGISATGVLHRWRWRTGEALEPLAVSTEPVRALASCQLGDRDHLVVASADGSVQAFDAESAKSWPVRIGVEAKLQAMAVGRHRGRIVAATAVRLGARQDTFGERDIYGIRLWEFETGGEIPTDRADAVFGRLYGRHATPGLTVSGWSDKPFEQLAMVETEDDLYIVALNSRLVRVWPLSDTSAGFDLEEGHDARNRILALSAGQGHLALARQMGDLELWRVDGRPKRSHGGLHPSVSALTLRRTGPVLASGGSDGFLRLWGRLGSQTLAVELGEPITSVAIPGEQQVAVGTRRGVLVFQIHEGASSGGPLDAELDRLRVAVRSEYGSNWHWDDRTRFRFPVTDPRSHRGPAAEVAALVVAAPADSFRALSTWLEDGTPLKDNDLTVADVACGLMTVYADLAFDCLADLLGDAVMAAGAELSKPWRVLQAVLVRAPAAAVGVCERWGELEPRRAELASAAANWVLWMSKDIPADLRVRFLICQQQILARSPTPQSRTEALHGLFDAEETRPLVMKEMLDRFTGKAEGYASPSLVQKALGTDFDIVLEAFERHLMRDTERLDYTVMSSLAAYSPANDAEADAIMTLFETLWLCGAEASARTLQLALLNFAAHSRGSLDRVIALATTLASSGDSEALRELLSEVASGRAVPSMARRVIDWIADTGDAAIKEELLRQLARAVGFGHLKGAAPDLDLFQRVLAIASPALESHAIELFVAAGKSAEFAVALDRAISATMPEKGGELELFAAGVSNGSDPQHAAIEALKIWRERRNATSSKK